MLLKALFQDRIQALYKWKNLHNYGILSRKIRFVGVHMGKKLELTWIGKEENISVEPRLLIENPKLSNTVNDPDTENMIIHSDNLLALKALETKYAGKVKCIYIDPPYNTGSAFEHYDDNLEHSTWLSLMKPRLEILRNLLSEDGAIFIQIDDNEQAYLKVLMDEIFGRSNFVNTVSVNMKNIAGASGGGEDKRLKKNCEYILIYAKNYSLLDQFTPVYSYSLMSQLVKEYKQQNKSWKYNSVLVSVGNKEYITSTMDGDGGEIKIFKRTNMKIQSVKQYAEENNISVDDVYNLHYEKVFRTTMPQSSIRPRVMDKMLEIQQYHDIISIEYVPRSGKNKGNVYEQFYSGKNYNLFAWLSDVAELINGVAHKKDLQGTYWDFVGETKNLTKEGNVQFPNGKKAEKLIERIFTMATKEGDLVLDSFLGSGTTAAVAHKMNRRYIGIEMGEHAYTHCKVRMDKVIDGIDQGGISKTVNWQGGGGYKFYELAPTLINKDEFDEPIINPEYDKDLLASAVALHDGFTYKPNKEVFWKQSVGSENSYLFVTTRHVTRSLLDSIKMSMTDGEYLVIACKSFEAGLDKAYTEINIKKIPQMLLSRCEFGKDNYNLNIIHPPVYDEDFEDEE